MRGWPDEAVRDGSVVRISPCVGDVPVRTLDGMASPTPTTRPRHGLLLAWALVLLAPLVGEYLLGNQPITALPAVLMLAPMYGCGALLIREGARRAGCGWPTMVLLAAAYALVEEGPIDQMLWNPHYGGVDMGLAYADTQVSWLGTSAALLQDVLSMHTVWSICVPIALVEAFGADRTRPWLGRPGLALSLDVGGPQALRLGSAEVPGMGGHHEDALRWASGGVDGELVDLGGRLVGPGGFGGQGLVPAQPGARVEAQQGGAAGVGEPDHGEVLPEPFEAGDGVGPCRQALTCGGQCGDGCPIGDSGLVGDALGRFRVDDLGVGVRPVTLRDAALFALHVLLPHGEQLADRRIVSGRHGPANCRAQSAGFVDQRSEDVEDDDLDGVAPGHVRSSRSRHHQLSG